MANKPKAAGKHKKPEPIGSAFDLLGKSVDIVKKNWQVFVAVNIFTIVGALDKAFNRDVVNHGYWSSYQANNWGGSGGPQLASMLGLSFALVLLLAIAGVFLYTMSISLQVKSTARKKPQLPELFEDGKKYFFRIIGVSLLSGLIILVGLILLIVPGIIAIGRLILAPYHLVDKDLGVVEALKRSNDQAIGKMGLIYAAIGVSIIVGILAGLVGVVPVLGPLVGAGITIAYSLVLALRYQQLKKA